MYQSYETSVGNNMKHVQITTKYRYKMMGKETIKTYCKVAIEEACDKHEIKIVIINVQINHVHLIVDCPRTMCDAKLLQIIKGLSSYLLFRICPDLRRRYPKGHLWSRGKFASSVGFVQLDVVQNYIRTQDEHHSGNSTL